MVRTAEEEVEEEGRWARPSSRDRRRRRERESENYIDNQIDD
jgi:hypothetical protein